MSYSIDHAIARLKEHHQAIRVRDGWDQRHPSSQIDHPELQRTISDAEVTLSNTATTHPQRRELVLLLELARGEVQRATQGRQAGWR